MKKKTLAPDCANCIHRSDCLRMEVGKFCPNFASRKPPARDDHDDPNTAWRTGRAYDD